MPIFTFTDEYSVNSPFYDDQHRKLFQLMNDVYDFSKARAPKPEIMRAFRDLYVFTMQHFTDEEAGMKRAKLDKDYILNHQKSHEDILRRMSEILAEYGASKSSVLPTETMPLFSSWLQRHILGTDKKYSGKMPLNGSGSPTSAA